MPINLKIMAAMIFLFAFVSILCFISYMLAPEQQGSGDLMSYECGLSPYKRKVTNFHLFSFKLSILFIVFDAEISLLIFVVFLDAGVGTETSIFLFLFVLCIVLSVYIEISMKFLDFLNW